MAITGGFLSTLFGPSGPLPVLLPATSKMVRSLVNALAVSVLAGTGVVIAPRTGRRLADVIARVGVPLHGVAGNAVGLAVIGCVGDSGERPTDVLRRVVPDADPRPGEVCRGRSKRAGEIGIEGPGELEHVGRTPAGDAVVAGARAERGQVVGSRDVVAVAARGDVIERVMGRVVGVLPR